MASHCYFDHFNYVLLIVIIILITITLLTPFIILISQLYESFFIPHFKFFDQVDTKKKEKKTVKTVNTKTKEKAKTEIKPSKTSVEIEMDVRN